ncbi:endonuclease/exonuclease/phosphatase family protein [Nocardia sp. NPDC051030]|uniref:endonuclease/exonuclease/phosphatase family protein n=1 Tax=Nocardia sp. NPDC051030 TaxID=3155162 RepID=UPI00343F74D0
MPEQDRGFEGLSGGTAGQGRGGEVGHGGGDGYGGGLGYGAGDGYGGGVGTATVDAPASAAPRKQSRRRGPFGWLASILGWSALLVGLAGVGLHYNRWETLSLVLAASFAAQLMAASLVALVLFAVARQWRSAIAAVVVIAAALWSQLPMMWPDGTAPAGVDVTVMQSNLLFGKADADSVVQAVRDSGVEVLTLEELTPEILERLRRAGLGDVLPYDFTQASPGGGGTAIFSRYPLQDGVKFDGFSMNQLRATMIHPSRGRVTVFAFHPIPPNVDFAAWQHELRRIRELLDEQTGQVIVGADFNSTYDHALYRDLLNGRYADSAELVGVGVLPTFPEDQWWGPIIGIDRVLVAGGHATEVRSLTIRDSDHRAVVARLRL